MWGRYESVSVLFYVCSQQFEIRPWYQSASPFHDVRGMERMRDQDMTELARFVMSGCTVRGNVRSG